MEREYINPPGLYRNPAFTRILSITGPAKLVFFAGQCANDEENNVVAPGDYLGQFRKVMEHLTVMLEAIGATWDDVVYKREYTVDIGQFLAAKRHPDNPKWGNPDQPPPSALIGVTELAQPDYLMEIELTVALPA